MPCIPPSPSPFLLSSNLYYVGLRSAKVGVWGRCPQSPPGGPGGQIVSILQAPKANRSTIPAYAFLITASQC